MGCTYDIGCLLDCYYIDGQGRKIPTCDGYIEEEEGKEEEQNCGCLEEKEEEEQEKESEFMQKVRTFLKKNRKC